MERAMRVGIGGTVGSGKTRLIEKLVPRLVALGFKAGVICNDVYTKEDAHRLSQTLSKHLDSDLIIGIRTGDSPVAALKDDPSANVAAIDKLESSHSGLDLVFIEAPGDDITFTFSPKLVDFSVYMVDVACGDKTLRKNGAGIKDSDLLIINKADLAAYVETTVPGSITTTVDLDLMMEDARKIRQDKPTVLVSLKKEIGVDEVIRIIRQKLLRA